MLYLFIIFVGAFLLFQVQPLIAKLILPLFGGGAAIWTACLLFFQAFLLLGYLYSHYLTKINSIKKQASIHGLLLLLSLFLLPIGLGAGGSDVLDLLGNGSISNGSIGNGSPMSGILLLLMISVGAPYFMLASTGPLVQRWLTYINVGKLPYKLYSLSNVGSLLALLSYPFIFEPLLTLEHQSDYWSIGYFIFVCAFLCFCLTMLKRQRFDSKNSTTNEVDSGEVGSGKFDVALWVFLSAVGVILLVSTTNAMTQNIPPVPFLWILPLCIYLLTFIISFHSPRWYVRWYWFVMFAISSFAAIFLFFIGSQFDIITQIVLYSFILLSACMICHGELARLKPSVDKLTLFYLNLSLGGFLGSAFVAFVAQKLFSQFFEFPMAIFCVYLLFSLCVLLENKRQVEYKEDKKTTAAESVKLRLLASSSFVSLLLLVSFFFYLNGLFSKNDVVTSRNFYGILSVKDVEINGEIQRRLIDGTTSHGTQSLMQGKEQVARSYYRHNTGVAIALEQLGSAGAVKAGFIGLGAGTLAVYGRNNDDYIFYELNPDVERFARSHFSYLAQSKANVDVVLGDARVTLTKELKHQGSRAYQLIVVDAFSGDSIPAHLLTKEAFALYWQHLEEDGVLAIHISNSHLDLTPLVRGLADMFEKQALYFKTLAEQRGGHNAEWVLVTNNKRLLDNAEVKRFASKWSSRSENKIVWTDNYSNLLSVLK